MTRFPSSLAHISPATYDYGDDEKVIAWLDGLRKWSPAEYAELAQSFFELDKNAEHFQAFLRAVRTEYELATGNRHD